MKKALGLLFLLLLALGGAFYLWQVYLPALRGASEPPPEAPRDPGRIEETTEYYEITALYPTETTIAASLDERADKVAVGLMKGFIETIAAQFKADGDFAGLTPQNAPTRGFVDGRKQTLQISYMSAVSSTTLSYVFTINTYTFGAHGNLNYKTFTFDTRTGASLSLRDLFRSGAYLEELSRISRERLTEMLELPEPDETLRLGTAPVERSFEHFFLDSTSLVFLFPPYRVAAYSAGPQTLAIPREELKELLKPEYQ